MQNLLSPVSHTLIPQPPRIALRLETERPGSQPWGFCVVGSLGPLRPQGFCTHVNGTPLQHSCLEKSHGLRSLVGYSPWGRKESDTTERLHFHTQGDSKLRKTCIKNHSNGETMTTFHICYERPLKVCPNLNADPTNMSVNRQSNLCQ